MFDKFSQALTLMGEALADAQAGAGFLAPEVLAAEVDGAQRVINAAGAVQALRVAQYAGREQEPEGSGVWGDVDHGVGHVSEFAADCFGPMLAMSPVAASRRVQTAAALAARLPLTLAAMGAGSLDSWRATIIATELSEASAGTCAAVEALVFPAVLEETPGAVTRRVRRVLARVDADAVRIKAAKERLERFVHAYPSRVPGLTCWVASLPAADSAACWAAIDDLAHRMHGDDPSRTLGQCRADALVDLMLQNVTVTTTVTLMIPVQTATVEEPDDSRERDLLARCDNDSNSTDAGNPGSTGSPGSAGDTGDAGSAGDAGAAGGSEGAATAGAGGAGAAGGSEGAAAAGAEDAGRSGDAAVAGAGRVRPGPGGRPRTGSSFHNPLAGTDDFGQPTADPNPFTEPTWAQICAMGYEIPGIGVIGGDIVAAILDRFDTRIARVLLDERTGVVIETSLDTYRPSPAIRRFTQKRDGTCRFPGCRRGANRCEPDHVTPYSRGGPTTASNLASLCKHHHRVKHNAGWTLTMTRQGVCTWTDPHGRQYATYPVDHHQLAA